MQSRIANFGAKQIVQFSTLSQTQEKHRNRWHKSISILQAQGVNVFTGILLMYRSFCSEKIRVPILANTRVAKHVLHT